MRAKKKKKKEIWGQMLEDKVEKFQSCILWGEVFRGRNGQCSSWRIIRLFTLFTCINLTTLKKIDLTVVNNHGAFWPLTEFLLYNYVLQVIHGWFVMANLRKKEPLAARVRHPGFRIWTHELKAKTKQNKIAFSHKKRHATALYAFINKVSFSTSYIYICEQWQIKLQTSFDAELGKHT